MLMKLDEGDELVAARILPHKSDHLYVLNENNTEYAIGLRKYDAVSRGGKGYQLFKRGRVVKQVDEELVIPQLGDGPKTSGRPPKAE
jgi:DNA gyrase/topoisomerase IV subunit A